MSQNHKFCKQSKKNNQKDSYRICHFFHFRIVLPVCKEFEKKKTVIQTTYEN